MASGDPGNVIMIDSSDEEDMSKDTVSVSQKRLREDDVGNPGRNAPRSEGAQASRSSGAARGDVGANAKKPKLTGSGPGAAVAVSSANAVMPPNPRRWTAGSFSTFKLPAFASAEGPWLKKFQDWIQVFYCNNLDQVASMTPALAFDAYMHYLDSTGLKAGRKKSGRRAARQFFETGGLAIHFNKLRAARASNQAGAVPGVRVLGFGIAGFGDPDTSVPQAPVPKARAPKATAPRASVPGANARPSLADDRSHQHATEKPKATVPEPAQNKTEELNGAAARAEKHAPAGSPADKEELALQLKYFGSAPDPANVCLLCAGQGHKAASCPKKACRFCGEEGHWDFGCPTKKRCSNCLQLGHATASCVSKPAVAAELVLTCAFCDSKDHLEDECTEFSRTFHPDADSIRPVTNLPISCAICASREHFLADCPERRNSANPTWSLANRNRYVDPSSGILCVEDAAAARRAAQEKAASAQSAPRLKMRGRAAGNANVHYSESEDTDMEFLDNRLVKQPRQVGQIRISSDIQTPSASGDVQLAGKAALPARPPTPTGRSRGRASAQDHVDLRPPAPALPARPTAPVQRPAPEQNPAAAPLPSIPPSYKSLPPRSIIVPGSHLPLRNRKGSARGGRGGRARGTGRGRGQ